MALATSAHVVFLRLFQGEGARTSMEEEKGTGLKGKVALVTGANHGIGAATAQALAAEGAAVFITYLRLHQQNATGSRASAGEEESIPGVALDHTRQAMSADHV